VLIISTQWLNPLQAKQLLYAVQKRERIGFPGNVKRKKDFKPEVEFAQVPKLNAS
jgi:hypothetical protein